MHSLSALTLCATLLLVTCLFCGVIGGSLGVCPGETCVGPVFRHYNGLDCQGEPSQYSQSGITNGFNQCVGRYLTTCSAETGVVISEYAMNSCQYLMHREIYQVGQCINFHQGNFSVVYQCSVNDSFITPGGEPTQHGNIYAFPTVVNCPSPNNCPSNMAYYKTDYNVDGCPAANATMSYGVYSSQNFSLGECFFDPSDGHHKRFSCLQDSFDHEVYDGDCIGTPYSVMSYPRHCAHAGGILESVICEVSGTTPPIASPTANPTSPTASPAASPTTLTTPTSSSSHILVTVFLYLITISIAAIML
jgi:hypothetical protein